MKTVEIAHTYQTSQNRKSGQHDADKRKSHDNRRAFRVALEDMMNLRQLAVSQNLGGWHRHVRIPVNRQLEGNPVVRARAAKRPNEQPRIERVGDREKLDGEVFLRLGGAGQRCCCVAGDKLPTKSSRDLPFSFTLNG